VGVTRFTLDEPPPTILAPDYAALARGQMARVRQIRQQRDAALWKRSLAALAAAARGADPLMPFIVDAVRARATVGEIGDALRAIWGEYRPNA
jgi:methylmalonyl-CoA mutase N-terminal domain/subunit